MRCLNREKVKIHYSNYTGVQEVKDSSGNYTGEKEVAYTTPAECLVTIGSVSGSVFLNPYGARPDYDRVMISDDINCPINENSIIWVDNKTTDKHDYVVKAVVKSLNCISYAIKKA